MKWCAELSRWLWLLRRTREVSAQYLASRDDLPKRLRRRTAYIIGSGQHKWVVLSCPCRCGRQVDVNLMPNREPSWQISVRDGRLSVTPSLCMPPGQCDSHYWIRNGRIDWSAAGPSARVTPKKRSRM